MRIVSKLKDIVYAAKDAKIAQLEQQIIDEKKIKQEQINKTNAFWKSKINKLSEEKRNS